MNVKFYDQAVETAEKTKDKLPVFENKLYVEITRSALHVINRPVKDVDIEMYPVAYAKYQAAIENAKVPEGEMPLKNWPSIRAAEIETLGVRDIKSVQQLANISDTAVKKMPVEISDLRDQANTYIEVAKSAAGAAEEITTLKSKIDDLDEIIKEKNIEIVELQRQVKSASGAKQGK